MDKVTSMVQRNLGLQENVDVIVASINGTPFEGQSILFISAQPGIERIIASIQS